MMVVAVQDLVAVSWRAQFFVAQNSHWIDESNAGIGKRHFCLRSSRGGDVLVKDGPRDRAVPDTAAGEAVTRPALEFGDIMDDDQTNTNRFECCRESVEAVSPESESFITCGGAAVNAEVGLTYGVGGDALTRKVIAASCGDDHCSDVGGVANDVVENLAVPGRAFVVLRLADEDLGVGKEGASWLTREGQPPPLALSEIDEDRGDGCGVRVAGEHDDRLTLDELAPWIEGHRKLVVAARQIRYDATQFELSRPLPPVDGGGLLANLSSGSG